MSASQLLKQALFLLFPLLLFACAPTPPPKDPCKACPALCKVEDDGKSSCIECKQNSDCKQQGKGICQANQCVQCSTSSDCPDQQRCDSNQCKATQDECKEDSDCQQKGEGKDFCVSGECTLCKPAQTRSCTLVGLCGKGSQTCNSQGQWNTCTGTICKTGEVCRGGSCQPPVPTCKSDETLCSNRCIDTQTDKQHCGSCDNACSDDQLCDKGKCKDTTCTKHDDCSTGEICEKGTCTACSQSTCQLGEKRCQGKDVEECKKLNGCPVWQKAYTCQKAEHCQEGSCKSSLWTMTLKNGDGAQWKAVQTLTAQGNTFITGKYKTSATFTLATGQQTTLQSLDPVRYRSFVALQDHRNGRFLWVREMPAGFNIRNAVVSKKENVLYISGDSRNSLTFTSTQGTFSLPNKGQEDMYLIQMDFKGNIQWGKTFGGNLRDYGGLVIARPGGGCLVLSNPGSDKIELQTKTSRVSVDTTNKPLFIALDSKGGIDWAKSYKSQRPSNVVKPVNNAAVTPQGDIVVAIKGLTLLLFKNDGTLKWTSEMQFLENNKPTTTYNLSATISKIQLNAKGEIFVFATGDSFVPIILKQGTIHPASGETNNLIFQYSPKGVLEWAMALRSTRYIPSRHGYVDGARVLLSKDGSFYMAGSFGGKFTVQTPLGSQTYKANRLSPFVTKLDSKGNIQWFHHLKTDSTTNALISTFNLDENGFLYLLGYLSFGSLYINNTELKSSKTKPFIDTPFAFRMKTDGTLP